MNARGNPPAHAVFGRLEAELRKHLEDQLSSEYGSGWWKQAIPEKVRGKCEERQQEDAGRKWLQSRGTTLLQYADFTDLKDIILRKHNWERCFSGCFGPNPRMIETKLEELHPIRLTIHHSRELKPEDFETLLLYSRQIGRCIGVDVVAAAGGEPDAEMREPEGGHWPEMALERLLGQILPRASYSLQHRFRNGEAVDAVIELGPALVPVEAKFPMESLSRVLAAESDEKRATLRRELVRTIRCHVDSVAEYIRPDEGTFDFALMYIPSESVYYETIVQSEEHDGGSLQAYALERKVIPVSPNSLYAYLQAIELGLRGTHAERRAQELVAQLEELKGDFGRFREGLRVLGSQVRNTANRYDELERDVATLDDKLSLPLGTEAQEVPPGEEEEAGQ